jgi:5-deoxy-D-glucuronate isomerase
MHRSLSILSIILSITLFGFTTSRDNISEKKKIINHAELIVTVDDEDGYNFFQEALYESTKGDIIFKTTEKVEKITVLQNGEKLVYVLPVKTKKIIIGKSLFDKGEYDLVFNVANSEKQYRTQVKVF